MTLEEKVHGLRLHVIRRAQALGNVSQASGRPGFPARCSTAGDTDWSAMVWTVSIPVGIGRVPAALWNWPQRRSDSC